MIRGKKENLLNGEIYVKLDNPDAGNSKNVLKGQFKGAVPIEPHIETFDLKKKSNIVITHKNIHL